MAAPVRYLSYTVDTILLTAALMLLTILLDAMFANGWLTAKLVLVVVYVLLGTFALKRGRTPRVRLACYVAALLVFATIIGIARRAPSAGLAAALARLRRRAYLRGMNARRLPGRLDPRHGRDNPPA